MTNNNSSSAEWMHVQKNSTTAEDKMPHFSQLEGQLHLLNVLITGCKHPWNILTNGHMFPVYPIFGRFISTAFVLT